MPADVLAGTRFVGPGEDDYRLFEYQTSDDVYSIVDRLKLASTTETKAGLARMEQAVGVNFVPDGCLFADHLRGVLRPIEHYIRDPMHVLVSGGVAGTETARVIATIVQALTDCG